MNALRFNPVMHRRHALAAMLGAIVSTTVAASWRDPVTVFLAGDSTMAMKEATRRPETGWGEALLPFFQQGKVVVDNRARNGRSTRTFIEEGLWQKLLGDVRPGDFVLIQFGHNDEVPSKTDRYTTPAQYRENLTRFVNDVRANRATPLLLTPVERRKFGADGVPVQTHAEYAGIVREVARELDVTLIDMTASSREILARAGADSSKALYLHVPKGHANYPDGVQDDTHFSARGAEVMAGAFVRGLRASSSDLRRLLK